jgi:adenine-specific DNA-methyltransferase
MAAAKKPAGPTQVEAIVHGEKRSNIPTADAQDFVGDDVQAVQQLRWPRDPSLDPQLVWKGKDADADELVADAPPIYIQEKIDPRVLIENLRDTANRGEAEPEMTLFDGFDGLNELDMVEFYQHEANWSNRMILGDSLQVMGSLAEREGLRGKVQMIYLDPPYGIKFGSNWQVSTRKRDVKDGKYEDATFEVEQIKAFRDTWELGIHSYLTYLRDRLMVARDLLTESGSVFVQIGDENVHLVRSLLDEVFGSENFVSQIIIRKTTGATADFLGATCDLVLWFARDRTVAKYRQLLTSRSAEAEVRYDQVMTGNGGTRPATLEEKSGNLGPGTQLYQLDNLTSQRPPGNFPVEMDGRQFRPSPGYWKTGRGCMLMCGPRPGLQPTSGSLPAVSERLPDVNNLWTDIGGRLTRRSTACHRRALSAVHRGDLVLDPTCGSTPPTSRSGATLDHLRTSRVALALARQRLMASKFPYFLLADSPEGRSKEQALTGQPLPISESRGDIRQGFVYERVQHITLKSIANNPDIREGMSRDEIDAAIKRHADFELLYDKPYEDKHKVRVTGPFTVESLSPHRSIAFAGQAPDPANTRSEAAAEQATGADFEQMILDNLRKAGIQNGRRNERLKFANIDAYPGIHVHAIGEREVERRRLAQAGRHRRRPAVRHRRLAQHHGRRQGSREGRRTSTCWWCWRSRSTRKRWAAPPRRHRYNASDDGFADVQASARWASCPCCWCG